MTIEDPVLRDVFYLWPAYQTLVDYVAVAGTDARTADPAAIAAALSDTDDQRQERYAALLFAYAHTESMDQARSLLAEISAMAAQGRRPRYGREVGLFPEMFRPAA